MAETRRTEINFLVSGQIQELARCQAGQEDHLGGQNPIDHISVESQVHNLGFFLKKKRRGEGENTDG
jgi:hypothetical protein